MLTSTKHLTQIILLGNRH